MDEFDVIDFVYEAIEAAGTGIAIYTLIPQHYYKIFFLST